MSKRWPPSSPAAGSASSGLPCYLSELRDVDRSQVADANVRHEANYGFQLHERDKVDEPLRVGDRCARRSRVSSSASADGASRR